MRVERGHEQAIAEETEPAVDGCLRAVGEIGGQLAAVLPERTAGARVERPCEIVGAGNVEDAVRDQRRRLEASAARHRAGLKGPVWCKAVDVVARDLGERAVASTGIVAGERQPP